MSLRINFGCPEDHRYSFFYMRLLRIIEEAIGKSDKYLRVYIFVLRLIITIYLNITVCFVIPESSPLLQDGSAFDR